MTRRSAATRHPQAGVLHSAAVVAGGAPPYIAPSRLQRGRFSPTGFICRATPARAGRVGSAADKRYSLGRMSTHNFGLPPFPDSLATALGHLMVRFQALETTLVFAIGRYIHPGVDDVPPPLTMAALHELPFASLVKLFSTIPTILMSPEPPFNRLSEQSDEVEKIRAAFVAAARLCTASEERRNQLMHSSWLQICLKPGEESVLRLKMRVGRKRATPSPPARESIETVTATINAVNDAMMATFSASASLAFFLYPERPDAA